SLIKGQILGAKERKQRDEIPKMLAPKVSFDFGLSVLTETQAAKLGDADQQNSAVKAIAREGDTRHVEFILN
ncbi:MAG: hypothetical protein RMH97_07355, partial [Verrucomicrobiales bacterium]|nr:hypothetical protein [Verrucomicrobiales bacterium]